MRVLELSMPKTDEEMKEIEKMTFPQINSMLISEFVTNVGVQEEKFQLNFRIGQSCLSMIVYSEDDDTFGKIMAYANSKGYNPKEI